MCVRMNESAAPLLLVEAKSKWRELGGIVTGFKRAMRRLQYITDTELLKTSPEEYGDIIIKHDFLLAIEIPPTIELVSYFPLDLRNAGAYTIGTAETIWPTHNFDIFVKMPLPGIFPNMIRILANKVKC